MQHLPVIPSQWVVVRVRPVPKEDPLEAFWKLSFDRQVLARLLLSAGGKVAPEKAVPFLCRFVTAQ